MAPRCSRVTLLESWFQTRRQGAPAGARAASWRSQPAIGGSTWSLGTREAWSIEWSKEIRTGASAATPVAPLPGDSETIWGGEALQPESASTPGAASDHRQARRRRRMPQAEEDPPDQALARSAAATSIPAGEAVPALTSIRAGRSAANVLTGDGDGCGSRWDWV